MCVDSTGRGVSNQQITTKNETYIEKKIQLIFCVSLEIRPIYRLVISWNN